MPGNRCVRSLVISVTVFVLSQSAFADWARWLGPTRDGHAPAGDFVPTTLPSDPKPVWKCASTGGFSSPVVSGNRLVFTDEDGSQEVAHLVDASTGHEIWKVQYGPLFQDEWGPGPRSTPIIDGDLVFVQSCRGEFRCLEARDGSTRWSKNFLRDFGSPFIGAMGTDGAASRRGYNGSALIDGDDIIVPVGATNNACLVCFEKSSGKIVWQSGNDEVAYSSPQIATYGGVRQIVALTADHLLGVRRDNGQPLWSVPVNTGAKRNAATPVLRDDTITITSYTTGLICTRIQAVAGKFAATQVWINRNLKINLATPVLAGGYFYGHGPRSDFFCADANTGELKWSQPGFGEKVSFTLALGDKLLVLSDKGELFLIAATPDKYTELGRVQVCGKTWRCPAYVDGRLYVRDDHALACFDLRK